MNSKKCVILILAACLSTTRSLSQTMPASAKSRVETISHALTSGNDHPAQAVTEEPTGPIQDIRTLGDFEQWSAYYYLYPCPNLTVKALKFADKNGVFDHEGAPAFLIALMSQIFAANPNKLASWIDQLSEITPQHKVLVWKALWLVNTEQSRKVANQLAQQFPGSNRPPVLSQASPIPRAIEKMDLSPGVLDMLWACFSVTGDQKYIERIMSALPGLRKGQHDANKMFTAGAAQWSLTANARQHKRVMEICLNARRNHPELQPELDKIIAQAKLPTGK